MTGTLRFNLPEEREEFQTAQNGQAYRNVLHDLDNELRSKIKHGELVALKGEAYQEIRNFLNSLLREDNLEL